MGKHRERNNDHAFEDDALNGAINQIEYALDDAEFFKQFEPKKTRQKSRGARDARRRIDEYWEDRNLTENLTEYYDELND